MSDRFVAVAVEAAREAGALLRERFGGEYDAYRARTWRLLPGLY